MYDRDYFEGNYYLFSEEIDAITPAELCCHTLLIDDGSRYRKYCLLLLSHVDIDEEDLREQAVKYQYFTKPLS